VSGAPRGRRWRTAFVGNRGWLHHAIAVFKRPRRSESGLGRIVGEPVRERGWGGGVRNADVCGALQFSYPQRVIVDENGRLIPMASRGRIVLAVYIPQQEPVRDMVPLNLQQFCSMICPALNCPPLQKRCRMVRSFPRDGGPSRAAVDEYCRDVEARTGDHYRRACSCHNAD